MKQDEYWLQYAIDLAKQCPSTDEAFAVGSVIIDKKGKKIAEGFSRETDAKIHAEESALQKVKRIKADLTGATLYSSLEPCNKRLSRPKGCAQLIIEAGITRVVFAAIEPPIFVPGHGVARLQESGVAIAKLSTFEPQVINLQSRIIKNIWKKQLSE